MAKKRKKNYSEKANPYTEEVIKKRRKFPVFNSVLLVLFVVLQVLLVVACCLYDPEPQDVIKEYEVTVTPREDGALNMEYSFVWEALDTSEDLTWVEIGMPNARFTVKSVSNNIESVEKYVDGDYVSLRLYFKRAYRCGETLEFSFRVFQSDMLCSDSEGYFYELVPGWFNATPVEHYTFRWQQTDALVSSNATQESFSYHVWEGELNCGSYVSMNTRYDKTAFAGAATVEYVPFEGDAYNELTDSKIAVVAICLIGIGVLVAIEVYMIDSFVSYNRGRGFLRGYRYHVHTYGYVNPKYKREQAARQALSSGTRHRGGFSGGGCACACACACAGGGRAGCSQKDTIAVNGTALRVLSEKKR